MNQTLPPELQQLMDRWVRAIESKDLDALAQVFRRGEDLAVFWSNGERNAGWDEVRHHIELDFRQEVDLTMQLHDLRSTALGDDGSVLTYRYDIAVSAGGETVTCSRQASMTVHRDPDGWRVAALHVSALPSD